MDKYCFSRNFFSRLFSCCVVNGVLGFLFGLCFLNVQRRGPGGGLNRRSGKVRKLAGTKYKYNTKTELL